MNTYFIERIIKDDRYTIGRFVFGQEFLYTLELPWKNNEPNISCIPAGSYIVEKTYSPRFRKKLWLIKDVPGRSGVRFHAANFVRELEGCIAPGLEKKDIDNDGTIDVMDSRKALDLMNEVLPSKFKLDIIWNDLGRL